MSKIKVGDLVKNKLGGEVLRVVNVESDRVLEVGVYGDNMKRKLLFSCLWSVDDCESYDEREKQFEKLAVAAMANSKLVEVYEKVALEITSTHPDAALKFAKALRDFADGGSDV